MLLEHLHHRPKPLDKKVQLMTTCLCDTFFDDVAKATVQVLEYLGCEISLPEAQTCCGQPAFNAGDWESSRRVVRHTEKVFAREGTVVIPSGSCAAMLFHGALLEFEKENDRDAIEKLANRSWELVDYIYNALDVKKWPGKFPARIAFHRSCHTRGTESSSSAVNLLSSIEGLEVIPFGEGEQCCGFGGTFSVTFPFISSQMGHAKLANASAVQPDYLVSGDMGCLMHLGGIVERDGMKLRTRHLAQILRDALVQGGLI
ncbi:(Fe-S)-binding protein [Oscillatoria laete-virens NRMC-F 0139]|nr:(Fe-S)-binding protein [Oscillatoria laete-virens]MDL5052188.1 (Fe-S)-binding protein [Oscillatoria laete-virens NRMC-F 0139]